MVQNLLYTESSIILSVIPPMYIRLLKIWILGSFGRLQLGTVLSEEFRTENGLKEGHTLSPLLFNLILENIILQVQEQDIELEKIGK